ncbi:MAG: hypothetical protein ACO23N_07710 [Opitutales bacterium]
MIKVARSGKVILELDSEDEFWAKVTAGEILPTDHCWTPSHVTWKLVSQLQPSDAAQVQARNTPARTIEEELDMIQMRVEELVNAPPLRRPDCCLHCGNDQLRTAQLVYEQGTRVGGAYDFGDGDVSVFASKNLQSMQISPPSAPGNAKHALGFGCFTAFLSFMTIGALNMLVMVSLYDGTSPPETTASRVFAALWLLTLVGIFVLVYRFLSRTVVPARMRRRADTILQQAFAYNDWKNTWICSACGRMTVRHTKKTTWE